MSDEKVGENIYFLMACMLFQTGSEKGVLSESDKNYIKKAIRGGLKI